MKTSDILRQWITMDHQELYCAMSDRLMVIVDRVIARMRSRADAHLEPTDAFELMVIHRLSEAALFRNFISGIDAVLNGVPHGGPISEKMLRALLVRLKGDLSAKVDDISSSLEDNLSNLRQFGL